MYIKPNELKKAQTLRSSLGKLKNSLPKKEKPAAESTTTKEQTKHDRTTSSTIINNSGIIINGDSPITIKDGFIHYDGKNINLETFNTWKNLERNSGLSSASFEKCIKMFIQESLRFKNYINKPDNKEKSIKDLHTEFEKILVSEYEQPKKNKTTSHRKKDKFGYFIDKDKHEKNFEKKSNQQTKVNSQEYNGTVSFQGNKLFVGNFSGEATVDESITVTESSR